MPSGAGAEALTSTQRITCRRLRPGHVQENAIRDFIARLELDIRVADVDAVVDQLCDFNPAASRTLRDRVQITITVRAEGLAHAAITALGVATDTTGHEVLSVQVEPTGKVDGRIGLWLVPDPPSAS